MRAGKLDRVITVESVSYDVSKAGGRAETWFRRAIRRAEVIADTSSETVAVKGTTAKATVRLRIRFMDLGFDDRIGFDGTLYEIASISEIGRRKALEIELVRLGDARP